MDTFGTSAWVKFFTDSGIPHGVACNYAVTFTDNRITKNMLLDLNKEILQDMGITVMGDVIAILKHSKVVHDQITRAKVFESEASVAPVLPERRNTPVTRLVDHYTKQKLMSSPWVQTPSTLSVPPLETAPTAVRPVAAKRPLEQPEVVAPKKARRVLPEHEGNYKISMPLGSTAKTKRLLQQQKALAAQNPIFKRLGAQVGNAPSTNTQRVTKVATTTTAVAAKKKVTIAAPVFKGPKASSVFARLGPAETLSSGEDEHEETTAEVDDRQRVAALPYKGILKTAIGPPARKTIAQTVKSGRTTTVPSLGVVGVKTVIRKTVANTRSGPSLMETRRPATAVSNPIKTVSINTARLGVGSQGILASRKQPVNLGVQSRLGAKARLGPAPSETRTTTPVKRISVALPQQQQQQGPFTSQVIRTAANRKSAGVTPTVVRTKTVSGGKSVPINSRLVSRNVGGDEVGATKKIGVFSRLGPMVGM